MGTPYGLRPADATLQHVYPLMTSGLPAQTVLVGIKRQLKASRHARQLAPSLLAIRVRALRNSLGRDVCAKSP